MKKQEEDVRIYTIVAGTVQVPADSANGEPIYNGKLRTVVQPIGRQAAQACHVTSKLRMIQTSQAGFTPITTIVLQARDTSELVHVFRLLRKHKLEPVIFSDENPEYGPGQATTAVSVLATKSKVEGILDYLPLWGSKL